MEPLEKCMRTLLELIEKCDPKTIEIAHRAIDVFLAEHSTPQLKSGALNALEQKLTALWRKSSGGKTTFINLIVDYTEERRIALQGLK